MPVNDQTPSVTLYDSNGVEMSVQNGVAIPANTAGLLIAGRDSGGVARFVLSRTDGVVERYLPLGSELLRVNSGWVSSGVVSNAAATLRDFSFVYKGPASRWLLIFNTTAVPANGTAPFVAPISLPSGAGMRVMSGYAPQQGDRFSTGISYALSTTEDTLTLDASTNVWVTAQYTSN